MADRVIADMVHENMVNSCGSWEGGAVFECIAASLAIAVGSLGAVGVLLTALSWSTAKTWPRVQARLKRSAIEERRNVIGPTLILDQYRPALTYAYEIKGRTYEGRRITFWDRRLWDDDRRKAEERIARLGEEFLVAVSPRRPHKAVIEFRLTSRELDFLGVVGVTGLLVAGVGGWVVWMMCPWQF